MAVSRTWLNRSWCDNKKDLWAGVALAWEQWMLAKSAMYEVL
jgi:hypothetical protein